MEEVRKKYKSMQELCLKIDSKNEWIVSLSTSSLELFLATIRKKLSDNPKNDVESMYKNIIDVSKIDEKSVDEKHQHTIKRYIEYFMLVAKSV